MPRSAHFIIPISRVGNSLSDISGMSGNLCRDYSLFHIVDIRQAKMLRRSDVTKESRSVLRGDCAANCRCYMIISGSYIRDNRTENIERRAVTKGFLNFHISRDLVHRHMSRPLNHDLDIFCPCALCKLTERYKLLYLSRVGSVRDTSRTAGVTQAQGHIVLTANLKNIVEMLVKGIFLSGHLHPGKNDRTAA